MQHILFSGYNKRRDNFIIINVNMVLKCVINDANNDHTIMYLLYLVYTLHA